MANTVKTMGIEFGWDIFGPDGDWHARLVPLQPHPSILRIETRWIWSTGKTLVEVIGHDGGRTTLVGPEADEVIRDTDGVVG